MVFIVDILLLLFDFIRLSSLIVESLLLYSFSWVLSLSIVLIYFRFLQESTLQSELSTSPLLSRLNNLLIKFLSDVVFFNSP